MVQICVTRSYDLPEVETMTSRRIRTIMSLRGTSPPQLGAILGVGTKEVEDWIAGTRSPRGSAARLLMLVEDRGVEAAVPEAEDRGVIGTAGEMAPRARTQYLCSWTSEARRELGMTTADLARVVGCSAPVVSGWEMGRSGPSLSALIILVLLRQRGVGHFLRDKPALASRRSAA